MITFKKSFNAHLVYENKTAKAKITVEDDGFGDKYVEIRPDGFQLQNNVGSLKIRKTDYANFSEERMTAWLGENFGTELAEALFWYIAETCFKLKLALKVVFT